MERYNFSRPRGKYIPTTMRFVNHRDLPYRKPLHLFRLMSIVVTLMFTGILFASEQQHFSYAVVISKDAYQDDGWREVADSLVKKYTPSGDAQLFIWEGSVTSCKDELAEYRPDYIGFVARPVSDCNSGFVVGVSRMCRSLDEDPYGDAVWGIITGYEAADALRAISESLEIKTVLAASNGLPYEPPLQRYYQGVGMPCESYTTTQYIFPETDGKVYTEDRRPNGEIDRINLVADWLSASSMDLEIAGKGKINGPVDCIITGGHGNVNLWQCHYPEAGNEGYMQSSAGQLYGAPYSGGTVKITATTPKVFWCASNCLMGNPDGKDNVVYAAFHSGHALQMYGFVNNASSGDEFMAWGLYDRVTKFAGRYTLPQGFFYARNLAQFELQHPAGHFTTSRVAMFMDSTVIYGDPAADVRFHNFGDEAKVFNESLIMKPDGNERSRFTYTVTAHAHNIEFGKGYCYQFRPARLLPVRINPATIVIDDNEGSTADITDNLVIWEMLAQGETLKKGDTRTLVWSAEVTDEKTDARVRPKSRGVYAYGRSISVKQLGNCLVVSTKGFSPGHGVCKIIDAGGRCREVVPVDFSKTVTGVTLGSRLTAGVYHTVIESEEGRAVARVSLIR